MGAKTEVEPMVYTVKEAAIALGLSPNGIYELIRSDRLPSVKSGRRRHVAKAAVVEYIARGGCGS